MKLHYSLLTVAIAFITGSNMFAMDVTEATETSNLEQSIDASKPIGDRSNSHWEDYKATLNNGRKVSCFKSKTFSDIPTCTYQNRYLSAEESMRFFALLKNKDMSALNASKPVEEDHDLIWEGYKAKLNNGTTICCFKNRRSSNLFCFYNSDLSNEESKRIFTVIKEMVEKQREEFKKHIIETVFNNSAEASL